MEIKKLIELALDAKENMTYTPYSKFNVGCVVEMEDGSEYQDRNRLIFTDHLCREGGDFQGSFRR